ncbi:glycosyltransferase family 4 protein [Blastococcus sp. SYSU DS0973]
MRLLLLGLEDPRRPGAGGGSARNHHVNRRLVQRGYAVRVLVARYAGCEDRIEDGVEYVHVGLPLGYRPSLVAYLLALPAAARRHTQIWGPDVVAEEFAPPVSSLSPGRWIGRPTVGLVHGFFAEEKAREYHLPRRPLQALERLGCNSHSHLVTNSEDVARDLEIIAPETPVVICGTGLDHELIDASLPAGESRLRLTEPGHLVYLGRLELRQKGLDLLLQALTMTAAAGYRVTIAGDGPDRARIEQEAELLGLSTRLTFVGRVTGAAKWRLLASAQCMLMPSRYETYGTAALESLAAGTPVLCFDIPNLRHTVRPGTGRQVASYRVEEFAAAIDEVLADMAWCVAAGRRGMEEAERHDWEEVASEHDAVYRAAEAGIVVTTDDHRRPVRPFEAGG